MPSDIPQRQRHNLLSSIDLQLAGIDEGGRRLPGTVRHVPARLWLGGHPSPRLEWQWYGSLGEEPVPVARGRDLLLPFATLADQGPEEVLGFAERFGPLLLCKCGLPFTHSIPRGPSSLKRISCTPSYSEPISAWKRHARRARGLLQLAIDVHKGSVGQPALWREIWGVPGREPKALEDAARILETQVQVWLELGMIGFDVSVLRPGARGPAGVGLWGALALELALKAAATAGLATCAGCGMLFEPRRLPSSGRRAWCPRCRERGLSAKQAKSDYRQRQRR